MPVQRIPTSLVAATGLIAGYAVAVGTGSRPLGGVLMAILGILCIRVWLVRDSGRTATILTGVGLFAFAVSHVLGLIIHPWPSVLVVAAATALACWRLSDSRWLGRRGASAALGRA